MTPENKNSEQERSDLSETEEEKSDLSHHNLRHINPGDAVDFIPDEYPGEGTHKTY